jgi:diguanylate cyclase (GGDEF)-like protein
MAEKELILVVDDDKFNVTLMREMCESAGYRVVEAHDGHQAVEKAVAEHPDLILLDIMMSGKDGFEVCLEIRARDETAEIPIIMVTALDDLDAIVTGIDTGADDYVTKPFRLFELQKRIRTAIDTRCYKRQLREVEEKLRKLGDTDIPGRIGGFRQLRSGMEYEFQRAQRYEHPLSCFLFSIDNYDATLENQGHKQAAALMGAAVTILKEYLRSVDRIYRVKDSEFIVLLPETPKKGARVAVDRCRQGLRQPKKPGTEPITITAALVCFPHPALKTAKDILSIMNKLHKDNLDDRSDCLIEMPE